MKNSFLVIALLALVLGPTKPWRTRSSTGSAVLQMIIAGIVGGLFVIKTYWRKLISIFTGKPVEEANTDSATASTGDDSN